MVSAKVMSDKESSLATVLGMNEDYLRFNYLPRRYLMEKCYKALEFKCKAWTCDHAVY